MLVSQSLCTSRFTRYAYLPPWSGLRPDTPKRRSMMSSSEKRQRTGRLPTIRCYVEEEAEIREKAADCGMSVGQYLLSCGLKRKTKSRVDAHIINELRRLGGLQKHLFNEGGGNLSKEYSTVLSEIRAAIARIGD